MKKKGLIKILLLTASVSLASCSSDDSEVYDELLSNTTWHLLYVTPNSEVSEDNFFISDDILDRLQSEMRIEQNTDTINRNIAQTNEYVLSFGHDNSCQLSDVRTIHGTYQLETYEEEVIYYPNQTYREDVGNGYTTEIIVFNDSITLRNLYGDELVRQDKMFLGKNNEVRIKGKTLNVSETKVLDVKDEAEKSLMTYKRDGSRIELSGVKHLTGIINDDATEIELDEIGTLYRQ